MIAGVVVGDVDEVVRRRIAELARAIRDVVVVGARVAELAEGETGARGAMGDAAELALFGGGVDELLVGIVAESARLIGLNAKVGQIIA